MGKRRRHEQRWKRIEARPIQPLPGRPIRVMPSGWLTAKEIAPFVGFSPRWVKRHLGQFAFKPNGRDYRWRVEDVDRWLTEHGLPPCLLDRPA